MYIRIIILVYMGRLPQHTKTELLDCATRLIANSGPSKVTIAHVAQATGAPVGSIYHRFSSIDEIKAEAWILTAEAFQDGFASQLNKDSSGLSAALFTVKWSRNHPDKSRLLLGYRRQELIQNKTKDALKQKANKLGRKLNVTIGKFLKNNQFSDHLSPDEMMFALVYMPYAAVRPYLSQNRKIPESVEDMVKRAFLSIIKKN